MGNAKRGEWNPLKLLRLAKAKRGEFFVESYSWGNERQRKCAKKQLNKGHIAVSQRLKNGYYYELTETGEAYLSSLEQTHGKRSTTC